ncbi:MAG: hypothetical protein KU37_04395 [Sulfuricurvum sp. PC08-66]|nr:MAG: hypothetical protein KU37_04395 [Sulfuricurvum sp. PC08-66]
MVALFRTFLLGLLLLGCQSDTNSKEKIIISSNPWVGFTPFSYAEKKGWLKETPFEFAWSIDLGENKHLFARGFTQGFTATQFEALHINQQGNLTPVFLIDKSNGADAIYSNISLAQLLQAPRIKAYFENDTLDEDFFDAFLAKHHLERSRFVITSIAQDKITNLSPEKEPQLLISYEPYGTKLVKRGFQPIESTATMKEFLVVDALFINEALLKSHTKDIKHLHMLFERAKKNLLENPKEFYTTIQAYLNGQTYEEFMASLSNIVWLEKADALILKDFAAKELPTRHIQ